MGMEKLRRKRRKSMVSSNEAGSVFRLFKHLGNIVKEPVVIRVGKWEEQYSPPSKVVISQKFFRSAKCEKCGKCCKLGASLVYTDSMYCYAKKAGAQINRIFINGEEESVYIRENNPKEPCIFLKEKGWFKKKLLCDIHVEKPTHCALPMIEIDRTKDSARLIKRPRGRNWRFGCPAKFKDFDYYEFLTWDLVKLKQLNAIAHDLGVRTWLPEILTWFYENDSIIQKGIPKNDILIYKEEKVDE